MREITMKRKIFEQGDVIKLKGMKVPNQERREGKIKEINVLILSTNITKNGTVNCIGVTQNYHRVIIKQEQIDSAEYVGEVNLEILFK